MRAGASDEQRSGGRSWAALAGHRGRAGSCIAQGAVGWSEEHANAGDFARHIANAGQEKTSYIIEDGPDEGQPLYVLTKIHPDRKFDAAMAAVVSWQAYLDATKKGQGAPRKPQRPKRIR